MPDAGWPRRRKVTSLFLLPSPPPISQDECSKYGPVLHVYVDRNSKGFVYLKVLKGGQGALLWGGQGGPYLG